MVDEDDERTGLVRDPPDQRGEVVGLLLGEAGGRLVEQHEPRRPDDGAGDLDETTLGGAE